MSRKKDFEEQLLQANTVLKRSKKGKRSRRSTKPNQKTAEILSITDSSIDTTNDNVDVEEDLCVVEVPSSSDQLNISDSSFIEMSAADKLKSQSNATTTAVVAAAKQVVLSSSSSNNPVTSSGGSASAKTNKKRRTRRGSGTSSEEERWLDAIESGKLEQVDDELKKIKDPKLMTARQRAMYERSIDKDQTPNSDMLFALPTGYKEKVMTAEAIEKAQLKSQKRKQMADEKREKDKRKTMDRLLKKQETKITKIAKIKSTKIVVPVISYRENITIGATLSYPLDVEFPMKSQLEQPPPKQIFCAICKDTRKRYNCSKTNVPLCSFKCYKSNLKTFKIATVTC